MLFKRKKELDLSYNEIIDVGVQEKVLFEKLGKSKLNRIIYSNYDKFLFYFN